MNEHSVEVIDIVEAVDFQREARLELHKLLVLCGAERREAEALEVDREDPGRRAEPAELLRDDALLAAVAEVLVVVLEDVGLVEVAEGVADGGQALHVEGDVEGGVEGEGVVPAARAVDAADGLEAEGAVDEGLHLLLHSELLLRLRVALLA